MKIGTSPQLVAVQHCGWKQGSTTASLTMLPRIPCGQSVAAWASWQACNDGIDEPAAHCFDRVRDVPLRPQGRILWVGNRRVWQAPGTAGRNQVPRGESSPVRRSGTRKWRCTVSHGDESLAILALQNARGRPLA